MQHSGDFVAAVEVGVGERLDGGGIARGSVGPLRDGRLFGDEEVVEVAGYEVRGGGLAADDVHDVVAV